MPMSLWRQPIADGGKPSFNAENHNRQQGTQWCSQNDLRREVGSLMREKMNQHVAELGLQKPLANRIDRTNDGHSEWFSPKHPKIHNNGCIFCSCKFQLLSFCQNSLSETILPNSPTMETTNHAAMTGWSKPPGPNLANDATQLKPPDHYHPSIMAKSNWPIPCGECHRPIFDQQFSPAALYDINTTGQ